MRIGDSRSESYKRLYARRRNRKAHAISRLCERLDSLVARAEKLKTGKTRAALMAGADKVREKLRALDH